MRLQAFIFTLDRAGEVSLYFLLDNISSGPIEISLVRPNGYRSTFLSFGKEFSAGRATVHPKGIPLEKGQYDIRLTFPQGPGSVSIYMKTDRRSPE